MSYQLHKVWETDMTFDLDLWPTDLNINRDHLLTKDYLPTKFEDSGAKRSWVISCTRLRDTDIPTDMCNAICPSFFEGGHKNYTDPTWKWGVMARHRFLVCVQWPWPWRYHLGSKSWHTLESWTTIVWNIIQIQYGSEELWPEIGFGYVCTMTLTFEICPWVKVMSHGQQLCKISSRSITAVRSYGPDICALWPWP